MAESEENKEPLPVDPKLKKACNSSSEARKSSSGRQKSVLKKRISDFSLLKW